MYLALATLYSLLGLLFSYWVVRSPDPLLRVELAEPAFDDVPDTTFDSRGLI